MKQDNDKTIMNVTGTVFNDPGETVFGSDRAVTFKVRVSNTSADGYEGSTIIEVFSMMTPFDHDGSTPTPGDWMLSNVKCTDTVSVYGVPKNNHKGHSVVLLADALEIHNRENISDKSPVKDYSEYTATQMASVLAGNNQDFMSSELGKAQEKETKISNEIMAKVIAASKTGKQKLIIGYPEIGMKEIAAKLCKQYQWKLVNDIPEESIHIRFLPLNCQ